MLQTLVPQPGGCSRTGALPLLSFPVSTSVTGTCDPRPCHCVTQCLAFDRLLGRMVGHLSARCTYCQVITRVKQGSFWKFERSVKWMTCWHTAGCVHGDDYINCSGHTHLKRDVATKKENVLDRWDASGVTSWPWSFCRHCRTRWKNTLVIGCRVHWTQENSILNKTVFAHWHNTFPNWWPPFGFGVGRPTPPPARAPLCERCVPCLSCCLRRRTV